MVKNGVSHTRQIMNALLVKRCLIVQHSSMLQILLVIANSAQMDKTVDRLVLVQLTVLLVTTPKHLI